MEQRAVRFYVGRVDNRIKRPCLSRLLEALDASGATFAYPQQRMFGEIDGIGLADVWDPARLRRGNYIDAMALLRRDTLIAAGGYATLANEHGWEDYDLWCRLAGLGYEGVFLPEILGEYRVHKSSMLRVQTAKYTKTLMAELMMRHPGIFCGQIRHQISFLQVSAVQTQTLLLQKARPAKLGGQMTEG